MGQYACSLEIVTFCINRGACKKKLAFLAEKSDKALAELYRLTKL